MARNSYNLLELDDDKVFEEHKIEEIIEIEKLLDAEIERKRVELRSMVGDRYKDVLAASDAIKNMKTISQKIVDNIETITEVCENLTIPKKEDVEFIAPTEKKSDEERALIIQVRLAIFMNEQIWIQLDAGDSLTAAQFYLLAQHIHIGLNLSNKEHLEKLPLLRQIKENLQSLKLQIFHKIRMKLESIETTAEETSSNLNALLLLKNQSTSELLNIFIDHRKTTLNLVMNASHASVRLQISAMVKCLITTIHLLHDCFISYGESKRGLIWQQLQNIVEDSSIPTLSKIQIPKTPLIKYLPNMITDFKPKYKNNMQETKQNVTLEDWLQSTKLSIQNGLVSSLELITNIKGLHIIREEALKTAVPNNWNIICSESSLPENFNVWYYFFQALITDRARVLISKKISLIIKDLEVDISGVLNSDLKGETDLRWYIWEESPNDVSRIENKHTGLSMKTLGYSESIVELCQKLDKKYFDLLSDASQYLYGAEYNNDIMRLTHLKTRKKFVDRDELENHLRIESTKKSATITTFLQDCVKSESNQNVLVLKSLVCARFLQAVSHLCPHFNKCCTFSGSTEDWNLICGGFNQTSIQFWENWIKKCVKETERMIKADFSDVSVSSIFSGLLRWDVIEIQEQTDEKVFKSQIKVPLKPTLILGKVLNKLSNDLSCILPHTLPKQIHVRFIENNIECILNHYKTIVKTNKLNQNQCLQFLFDIKFLTTFSIARENSLLVAFSQEICDILRGQIDPFDLDVFYRYLQTNVKRAVVQSQAILGCLLPSSAQLANLGVGEKFKDQEKDPSVLALSVPSVNFPMFCTFAHQIPAQKAMATTPEISKVSSPRPTKTTPKKSQDPTAAIRSSAAALFGGLKTDWFS